jgi:hypothetical protein
MNGMVRRLTAGAAAVCGLVLAPLAVTTIVSPAVSSAQCAPGQFWNASSNSCDPVVAPPPPPPYGIVGPVSYCIGAPIPFVPMSWCVPIGPTGG